MFILEEPYVSSALARAATRAGVAVLDTPMAREALAETDVELLGDEAFARAYAQARSPRLYANSENAIGWIAQWLADTALPDAIDAFKDKVRFRHLVADLFPDYRFFDVRLEDLAAFDPTTLKAPFVVKPAVGFFSMGVHVVDSPFAWPEVVARIEREVESFRAIYPEAVLGLDRFVIEEVIEGEEYAVDAYFDSEGNAVVLNVLSHLFASADDVSDRVYLTSPAVIEQWHAPFATFLTEIGRRAGLRDFPVHAELRVDATGRIAPIEINPMRFAGWCVTDIAQHAYGIDPYDSYLNGLRPDWETILPPRRDHVTAMVVADLPASVDRSRIEAVDHEGFEARFTTPLEIRRVDHTRYPVFAFAIVQVPADDLGELHAVLGADLTTHLTMRTDAQPVPIA